MLVPFSQQSLKKKYFNFIIEHTNQEDSYVEVWNFARSVEKGRIQLIEIEEMIAFNVDSGYFSCVMLGKKAMSSRIKKYFPKAKQCYLINKFIRHKGIHKIL